MSLHDEYARRTPYELVFPDADDAARLRAAIERDVEASGLPLRGPMDVAALPSVADFVSRVAGDDTPVEAGHLVTALVYHALSFDAAGRRLLLLSTPAARYLVEGPPPGEPVLPADAGYLQLPQHLFWTGAADGGGVPESVDGIFWSAEGERLHVLLVTGMRPDRPGVGVVPLPEAPLVEASTWLDATARPDGEDFSSAMPGAELDGLYALEAAGEVLKLLGRVFAYVAAVPGGTRTGSVEPSGAPPPSRLPHERIELHA